MPVAIRIADSTSPGLAGGIGNRIRFAKPALDDARFQASPTKKHDRSGNPQLAWLVVLATLRRLFSASPPLT